MFDVKIVKLIGTHGASNFSQGMSSSFFPRASEACEDFNLVHPYISSLTVYTESRVCVCSTCVAVFARCVVLSRGCGMIRAKSSTTQVCFICGVAGCEIRGWRSRSIFNLLPRAGTPPLDGSQWFVGCLTRRYRKFAANLPRRYRSGSCGACEIMQSPACYVKRIISIMWGILFGRISTTYRSDMYAGISMSSG